MEVKPNKRPLIYVILTCVVAGVVSTAFFMRDKSVVRAPCTVYPIDYAPVQSPREGGRVVKVLKKMGDTVKAGEPLVMLDTEDLENQRNTIKAKVAGLQEQIRQFDLVIASRKATLTQARETEKYAISQVETEKMILKTAQANLERAGPGPAAIEIGIAATKVENATATFEAAKTSLDAANSVLENALEREKLALDELKMYQGLLREDATTPEQVRLKEQLLAAAKGTVATAKGSVAAAKGAVATATGAMRDREGELKLLKEVEIPTRLALAQAEVGHRTASIKGFEAAVQQRHAEVLVAEANIAVDETTFKFKTEIGALLAQDKELEYQIKDKVVTAPLSGYLDQFRVQKGHWINYREALGTIYDVSTKVVHAHVHQKDLAKVAVGQPAKVRFEGDIELDAEVMSVEPLATPPPLDTIEPLALLQEPMKGTWTPRSLVKLKLLDSPNVQKVHIGFPGLGRILVDSENPFGKLFFR